MERKNFGYNGEEIGAKKPKGAGINGIRFPDAFPQCHFDDTMHPSLSEQLSVYAGEVNKVCPNQANGESSNVHTLCIRDRLAARRYEYSKMIDFRYPRNPENVLRNVSKQYLLGTDGDIFKFRIQVEHFNLKIEKWRVNDLKFYRDCEFEN